MENNNAKREPNFFIQNKGEKERYLYEPDKIRRRRDDDMMMIPMMIKCDVCVHVYVYTTVLHGVALSCCARKTLFSSVSFSSGGAAFSSLCLFSFLARR